MLIVIGLPAPTTLRAANVARRSYGVEATSRKRVENRFGEKFTADAANKDGKRHKPTSKGPGLRILANS
jgi:hypothetical protein